MILLLNQDIYQKEVKVVFQNLDIYQKIMKVTLSLLSYQKTINTLIELIINHLDGLLTLSITQKF